MPTSNTTRFSQQWYKLPTVMFRNSVITATNVCASNKYIWDSPLSCPLLKSCLYLLSITFSIQLYHLRLGTQATKQLFDLCTIGAVCLAENHDRIRGNDLLRFSHRHF